MQSALVTGSSRGIGLAIAQALDKQGIKVTLTGRSRPALDAAYETLSSTHGHHIHHGDLTTEKTLEGLKALFDDNGYPQYIVHALGAKIEGDAFPLDVTTLRASMTVNLETSVRINNLVFPNMSHHGFGRIIHMSSDASLNGKCAPAYACAKAALNAYVMSTASMYARDNVMLCAILPGIIEHPESEWAKKKIESPMHYQERLKLMPLGRFGQPEEVASIATKILLDDSMLPAGSLIKLTGAY